MVLFLCTHKAGRSRMGLGVFSHYSGDRPLLGPVVPSRATRSALR
jgi:protein-tyrosine-phosphatase